MAESAWDASWDLATVGGLPGTGFGGPRVSIGEVGRVSAGFLVDAPPPVVAGTGGFDDGWAGSRLSSRLGLGGVGPRGSAGSRLAWAFLASASLLVASRSSILRRGPMLPRLCVEASWSESDSVSDEDSELEDSEEDEVDLRDTGLVGVPGLGGVLPAWSAGSGGLSASPAIIIA